MNRRSTIGNEILPFFDYVAVLRSTLLFPIWTLVLLGYHHGSMMLEASTSVHSLQLWTTLCLYTLLSGAIYIVNQITDRETDATNDNLYLVAQGYVNLQVVKWQIGTLITLSIVLSLLVFRGNLAYLSLISLSTILGFIYSGWAFFFHCTSSGSGQYYCLYAGIIPRFGIRYP